MTDRELMQQALDALVSSRVFVTSREKIKHPEGTDWYDKRITALREALAQPEQEPVAWMGAHDRTDLYCRKPPQADVIPLYTAPPQREWQGLTDDEILEEYRQSYGDDGDLTDVYFARAIEAKLKEKNT